MSGDEQPASQTGVLLFGHGARSAGRPFEAVPARRASGPMQVTLPGVDAAAATRRNSSSALPQIDVVPLFLGAGGHVGATPPLLQRLQSEHPAVDAPIRSASIPTSSRPSRGGGRHRLAERPLTDRPKRL
jgi:sirohydrochlorin cobaltochelatase